MKTRSMPRLSLALVALSTMLLLAVLACGGGGPEELEIPVKLIGDKLDPETIRVGQGDSVTLMIEVEEPGEFHLHGYDIEQDIEPGEAAELFFVADATGRFRITYHPAGNGEGSHSDDQQQSHESLEHQEGQEGTEHQESQEGSEHDEEEEEVDVGFLEVLPK